MGNRMTRKEFTCCSFSPDASSKKGHVLAVIAATWQGENKLKNVEWCLNEEARSLLEDVTKIKSLRNVLLNLHDFFKEAATRAVERLGSDHAKFWDMFFDEVGCLNFSFTEPAETDTESLKEILNQQIRSKEELLVTA